MEERPSVRSVERALDILLTIGRSDQPMSLTDIATGVELHKSTVHRLLSSLEQKGFVRRVGPADRYSLGLRILELARHTVRTDDVAAVALTDMRALRDELGETVSLYVRIGHERIRVQAVEGTQAVRRAANIGQRFPLYIGASGKVLLAFSPKQLFYDVCQQDDLPESLHLDALERQLARIREQGYATSIEEREVGAAAVAVPVLNADGICVAALSVSGPVDRYPDEQVSVFANACQHAAARIAERIL